MKIESLKEEIKNVKEPRRTGYGNIRHKLEDIIIIIGLCTVICGGEDFVDMEEFGKSRKNILRNFLNFPTAYLTATHSEERPINLIRLRFHHA